MADGMVKERLNVYFLINTSGSMAGLKIKQLNSSMHELIHYLYDAGVDNNIEIVVRAVEFGNNETISWLVGCKEQGVYIDRFNWINLSAEGISKPTARAIKMIYDALDPEYLGTRTLNPVVILISDGGCTDGDFQYKAACNILANKFNGRITRIALAVDNADKEYMNLFASKGYNGEKWNIPFVFDSHNAEQAMSCIRMYYDD